MLLIGVAVLTVVLSWTVVNTIYTLRYAHLGADSDCSGAAEVSVQGVKLSDQSWLRSMAVTGLAPLIRPGGEAR